MNSSVKPLECLPFKFYTPHREVGRTPSRSPTADGRDGGDVARQRMEAARAREKREKER
jgi:hypothetical protein